MKVYYGLLDVSRLNSYLLTKKVRDIFIVTAHFTEKISRLVNFVPISIIGVIYIVYTKSSVRMGLLDD